MTLTLKVGTGVVCATHPCIMAVTSAKLFKNAIMNEKDVWTGQEIRMGRDGHSNAGDSYIITPTPICESWGIIIIEL